MKRVITILAILVIVTISLAGCSDDVQDRYDQSKLEGNVLAAVSSQGFLKAGIHDAPPEYDIRNVWLTIESIEVHVAQSGSAEAPIDPGTPSLEPPADPGTPVIETLASGSPVFDPEPTTEPASDPSDGGKDGKKSGWISLTLSGTEPIDIIHYQDGLIADLVGQYMDPGKYTQIRMYINNVEVTYAAGDTSELQTMEAKLPSGKIHFNKPFNIVAGETTVLDFDFVVDEAVTITGDGKVIVKPVIKLNVAEEKGMPGGKGTPTGEPAGEPTSESTDKPTTEPTGEPTAEPTTEPSDGQAGEQEGKQKGKPTTETTTEGEPTPEDDDAS